MDQYEQYGFLIPDPIKDEFAKKSLDWVERMETFFAMRRVAEWQGCWLLKSDDMPL